MIDDLLNGSRELSRTMRELADQCGDGPAGIAAKEHIARTLAETRRLLYAVVHGEEPPCELPDTWEDDVPMP
jgi:hypothetical protein